jgi:radical SAM superfamily enzyme with C-terminal helix-hairpin-helix motif
MYGRDELAQKHKNLFLRYKEKIRSEIDLPMLRRLVPAGTVLREVRTEVFDKITFGRQLGSYPLLVGIPAKLEPGMEFDIMVTGHGFRSITGIPVPLDINRAPLRLIQELPGAGKKQAGKIMAGRPYKDRDDVAARTGLDFGVVEYVVV